MHVKTLLLVLAMSISPAARSSHDGGRSEQVPKLTPGEVQMYSVPTAVTR